MNDNSLKKIKAESAENATMQTQPTPPPPPIAMEEHVDNEVITIDEMIAVEGGIIGPAVINEIPFYLLGKVSGRSDTADGISFGTYGKIAILSGDPRDPRNRFLFWAYQSQSEIGMWRLCYRVDRQGEQMDKLSVVSSDPARCLGDYVQSTLIAIELQQFINANIERMVLYNTPAGVFYGVLSANKTLEGLPNINGIINCKVFNEGTISPEEFNDVSIGAREVVATTPPFNAIGIFCGQTRLPTRKRDGTLAARPIQISDINDALRSFSEVFETHYRINTDSFGNIDNTVIYPNYAYTIVSRNAYSNLTVRGDIYSVTLVANNPAVTDPELQEVRLIYFRTLEITGTVRPYPYPNYYMPITILPRTAVCNRFGVYSRYMRAGIYVCKLFDYVSQCTTKEKEYQCTDTYAFVGDRYVNLFPYNQIQAALSPSVATQELGDTQPIGDTQILGGRKKRKFRKSTTRRHRTRRGDITKRRTIRRHKITHRRQKPRNPTRRRRRQ